MSFLAVSHRRGRRSWFKSSEIRIFPYPKPQSLIYGLLKQATGPDDIVLDFFGGSGTTGHAVLALNAEDGGNRRFIVVSSTEATAKDPEKKYLP